MADHKECKHYEECGYKNDVGVCPNWCAQFKHRDDVRAVRCKDCKYYEIHKPKVLENCERNGYLIPMKPDDYCSYGERKDNG